MDLQTIVNSEGLSTFVLLVTGISAFSTYFLQKKNEVRDAATIILNEIRNAESTITALHKTKVINDLSVILAQSSWQKYSHLFARKLDQDEFAQINDFYRRCEIAEQYRKIVIGSQNESIAAKARYLQYGLMNLFIDDVKAGSIVADPEKRQKFIEMMNTEDYLFRANAPLDKLVDIISHIPHVTTSSAGAKIKKLGG